MLRPSIIVLPLLLAAAAHGQDASTARGEYIATLAGCVHCHTADGGTPFAGGLTLDTPFGKLATPNITPDETGIKGWTLEDFTRVLHEGKNKDGAPLYPAMPYTAFTKITDEDVAALWSFISSLDPVENKVEVNLLPFPFDVRASVGVWQAMFFEEGRFKPNDEFDDQMNRGAYIVEALAHCSACHTPRNPLGAQIESKRFQGAATEQWYAPDISRGPNSVLTKWDEAGLTEFLSGAHARNIPSFGPMNEVTTSLSEVTSEDVAAIAAYMLKGQPLPEDSTANKVTALPEDMAQLGDGVFDSNCKSCHGEDGKGIPGVAASLVNNGGVIAKSPENVVNVLLQGIAPTQDYGVMPSFAEKLSDEKIAAVANHVRRSWGNDGARLANAELVAHLRSLDGPADPAVDLAVNCRSVPSDAVTPELQKALSERAQTTNPTQDDLAAIATAYAKAKPDLSSSERLTVMSGLYCRELAIAEPDMPKAPFVSAQIAFVQALGEVNPD